MTHIVLLLYLISGFSGIGSMIYLIMKYGYQTSYMRGHLSVHISYTLMMMAALVLLYLRVNVIKSPLIMSFFLMAILLGQSVLSWTLSRFSFILNKRHITGRIRILWGLVSLFYVFLAVLQILLIPTEFSLVPIITGSVLFILISLYFTLRNSRGSSPNPGEVRVWVFFLVYTLLLISLELFLKFRYGFLGDYTINIPLIFLSWNVLTLMRLKNDRFTHGRNRVIPGELIDVWKLTEREVEIARAIIRGESNKDIAANLNLSFSTVKNHIYNLYRKAAVRSRVELINKCFPAE